MIEMQEENPRNQRVTQVAGGLSPKHSAVGGNRGDRRAAALEAGARLPLDASHEKCGIYMAGVTAGSVACADPDACSWALSWRAASA
jgi:hypothetical protein